MIVRALILSIVALGAGCSDEPDASWQVVHEELPGALLSVWGTSADDVWAVGGDPNDGMGPMVVHWDGAGWQRLDSGHVGDLWWVFGFAGGPIYMGGAGGAIVRYQGGTFSEMSTPGTDTVFGIWGSSPDDVWAVGGAYGGSSGAFAWKLDGDAWVAATGFPTELATTDVVWKVYGRGPNDVWLVGTAGLLVHWDGQAFTQAPRPTGESLFTVHASGDRFAAVGGFATGILIEHDGSAWAPASPSGSPGLVGVCLTTDGGGFAVGQFGEVYRRRGSAWQAEEKGFYLDQTLHSVWIDPDGGVWAVGGDVLVFPLVRGVMLHKGEAIATGGL